MTTKKPICRCIMVVNMYKSIPYREFDNNIINIPPNWIEATEEGMEEFNKIYTKILEERTRVYVKTASGGICKKKHLLRIPCYNINFTKSSIELIYIGRQCYKWRFRSSYLDDEGKGITGKRSFEIFKRMVEELGGDLNDLAIPDGKMVKETIPSPKIDAEDFILGREISNAYHIDLNSAFMAGIKYCLLTMPQTTTTQAVIQTIDHLYEHRKDGTEESRYYKDILTHSYGYFQSAYCVLNHHGYALAHLSKAAIEYTNKRLEEWDNKIKAANGKILAHNTDGIWFVVYDIYNKKPLEELWKEDKGLGDMKLDVKAKKIRFKSKGAYEYIDENDNYTPKVRGRTRRDYITPRSQWKWGDIYQKDCEPIKYSFIEGVGIIARRG